VRCDDDPARPKEAAVNNEALKSWLDAMPIDDVRRKIERLEAKLSDLRVLERVYGERHPDSAEETPAAEPAAPAPAEQHGWGEQQG
jgi:hypothetical protein